MTGSSSTARSTPREKWTALGLLVFGTGTLVGVIFGPEWVQDGAVGLILAFPGDLLF